MGQYIGFKALQGRLQGEGKSAASAARIAGAIGIKKYGKAGMAGMARKAAAGRKKNKGT